MITRLIVGLLCLQLVGCGLHPLYGGSRSPLSADEFSDIFVEMPNSRMVQLVRNEMTIGSNGAGSAEGAKFVLVLTDNNNVSTVLASKTGFNRREMLDVNVSFILRDNITQKEVFAGRSFAVVPYDRGSSEFNNLQAVEDAQKRAAKLISEDIRNRLSVHLASL
jgi:hypothetical protein